MAAEDEYKSMRTMKPPVSIRDLVSLAKSANLTVLGVKQLLSSLAPEAS
jgi:hypothetical protein